MHIIYQGWVCSNGKWVEPQTFWFGVQIPSATNGFSGTVARLTRVDQVIYREKSAIYRWYIVRYRRFLEISPEISSDRYFSMKYRIDTLRYTIYRRHIGYFPLARNQPTNLPSFISITTLVQLGMPITFLSTSNSSSVWPFQFGN